MTRQINLRQVEAFKAVIENGTVSRAAELLHISQPAMSKLIAHLEFDTGLKLFDRVKGRLAPTEHGMRLYAEIERIFAGVRQVENAVDAIRREEQGRLAVGVMPALAGTFIQEATTRFLKLRPNVFFWVQARGSQWIVDWVIERKLDLGIVEGLTNPYTSFEPLMKAAAVCIMPFDHPLTDKITIEPQDLNDVPFVSFPPDSDTGHRVNAIFDQYRSRPRVCMVANWAQTVCEFVAAGHGVALVHPMMASSMRSRLAVRRFEPEILDSFFICRSSESRSAQLVDAFSEELRAIASELSDSALSG